MRIDVLFRVLEHIQKHFELQYTVSNKIGKFCVHCNKKTFIGGSFCIGITLAASARISCFMGKGLESASISVTESESNLKWHSDFLQRDKRLYCDLMM